MINAPDLPNADTQYVTAPAVASTISAATAPLTSTTKDPAKDREPVVLVVVGLKMKDQGRSCSNHTTCGRQVKVRHVLSFVKGQWRASTLHSVSLFLRLELEHWL